MHTGPKAESGFDLALTEVLEDDHPPHKRGGSPYKGGGYFVVDIGSQLGAEVMAQVSHRSVSPEESAAAERVVAKTVTQMGREMDNQGIKELLYRNYEHPRWDDVASRCLSCANCTMVCPTCFCSSVEEVTDLAGQEAERVRRWDSCFTLDFSYIHGGNVRSSVRSRYRQWMTHKLAHWIDQFGSSGCVGCGRCITWCPVGIDITEEAAAIRAAPQPSRRDSDEGA
jgi:formate hydrogenlyase subunit 6/NADH:ubiquinone oxidoreductase subunit I